MARALIYSYDKKRDVPYVSIGQPRDAVSREVRSGIFVHLHPRTGKVIGYTLLDFQRRASRKGKAVETSAFAIPVEATFRLPLTATRRRSVSS